MEENEKTITEENDLSIYVTNGLKPSRQCAQASQKSVSILGTIRRNFTDIKQLKTMSNTIRVAQWYSRTTLSTEAIARHKGKL